MPTPSTDTIPPPSLIASDIHRSVHATCPPDDERPLGRTEGSALSDGPAGVTGTTQLSETQAVQQVVEDMPGSTDDDSSPTQQTDSDADHDIIRDSPSPMSVVETSDDSKVDVSSQPVPSSPFATDGNPSMFCSPTTPQLKPSPKYSSSFLRPGSSFAGTQQSDRQVYKVHVEIKHVDMSESFVCGYLRIEGLTADHPTLTTYFEGEIIGTKYTFKTRHAEWGSNEKVDKQHWNRFPAYNPLARAARSPDFSYKDYAEREHLFMRWKEYFLVPDHRVRTISGASFEGFYYICFNQISGTVSGIYFHSKSEKFQQLELKHVDDHGCMGAMEFR